MVSKILRVLKSRPLFFFQYVRTQYLFQRTRYLISVLRMFHYYPPSIVLKKGARVQRVRCLRVELPNAKISVGENSIIYENAKIEAYDQGQIEFGACSVIGDARIYSRGSIKIGARFLSSWNVLIQDYDAHPLDPKLRGSQVEAMCGVHPGIPEWNFPIQVIEIGDDVWVGANVTILKGAKIGSGCVIAAGSVVVGGEWPARSVLAGSPAKVVKSL